MKTAHEYDTRIADLEDELATLRAIRSFDIHAAHTFTAADYRIKIVTDDDTWTIKDIMGEPAGEGDAPSVFEYQTRLEAIFAGTSREELWSYGVIVEERDPETGEFDQLDSTWGFHYLSNDSWKEFEKDTLLYQAKEFLPDGINIDDVEIVRE